MKFTNDFENVANSTFSNEGNVSFENDKSLTNKGTFNAEQDSILITSGNGKLNNESTLNAKGATFKGTIENNGTIETIGNNTFDGTITNEKDATFTAKDGNVKIEQDLTNKGTLNAEAGSSFSTSSTGKIVNQGTDANNKGTLKSNGATFEVEVENKENGEITSSGDNSFKKVTNEKGATFTNSGNTTFTEGITNKGTLDAESGSTISGAITNDGTAANDNGTLNAKGATFNGAVTNTANGKITATGENNFKGGVTNQGTFEAEQNSKISGDITNEKTLTAKGATFDSTITNSANGTITAKEGTNTFNGAITNSGTIEAKGATFGAVTNKDATGKINLEGDNTFSGTFDNGENATLTNKANANSTFNGDLVNKGTIDAENGSSFKGTGTIQNESTLNAKDATFENAITNSENGVISASGENTFNSDISNSGNITANDASKIKGTGIITNESTGTITANGATFENAIDNKGTLKAEAAENKTNSFNDITTSAGSKIEVSGKGTNTFSKSFVNVKDATFTNSTEGNGKATLSEGLTNNGTLENKGDIEIKDGKVLTNSGTIDAENGSKFTGDGTITNNGELNTKGATFNGKVTNESGTINVSGDNTFTGGVDNKGTLNAEASSTIKGGTLTNESSGVINAKGATFEGAITNSGKITANGTNAFNKAITTNADSTIEITDGTTTFKEDLTNVADATLINKGEIKIETNGKKLINQGLLEAESGSKFSGDGSIENEKTLNAKGATFDTTITNKANGVISASGENSFNKKITTSDNSTIDIVSGTATFKEELENVANATLKNSGTISIDASKKITNKGLLEAESGSKFEGAGTIENEKTLNAKGATFGNAISNKKIGVITATGENAFNGKVTTEANSTIDISNGKTTFAEDFENVENATLTNNGEVVFSKTFTNKAGTLTNNGEIIFNGAAKFQDKSSTATDYTNQSSSTLTFNDSAEFKGLTNQNGTININGDGDSNNTAKNFKAESITNYGNINANGGYIEATNGLNNHSIFRATGALSTIKGKFSNKANGNVYLQGTTLKVTDEFKNDGNIIFSFLGDAIGQIDASDSGASFKNTDNKGKVQVDLSGSGKNIGEKTIIVGKDNNGPIDNITLKESDVSFIGGSGKYLGNGKVLIDEVFANVPTGTINTPIIATNKANVASMNSMFLVSNAIISSNIYNAKYAKRMANRNDSRQTFALSALKSNESFYYDSKPLLLADARDSAQAQASGAQNAKDNFYFLLTPFVNHTSFKQVGGMSVSGLDYGFITAFGGKVAPDNTLGLHFVFDYAKLGDKHDKSLSATNKNIMVGLNYRLDLIYEMYFKARGDFYYFMNDVNSNATGKSSPNNLGGGVNVAFGKDFVDWKQAGVLGIELGLDYKALSTGKVSTEAIFGGSNDGIYDKALYHILYADLGLNYYKYFSTNVGLWGFDAGLGARANLTPKVSSNRLMIGNRNIDITLDNDNFLGYVSVGGSYVLEAQNYDMEFTLRYNGSFGDKTISNGGSFEWRTKW